ncbi:ABC transporter permease [Halalkalicoccus jeotgali]|uniref:Binding-protein-dependent transport systems inner membrane component n=1 Tax=Halalkalicoccus jeotgali (strain DSM 18796 / CECT 7217 / JCM 14584 / KCTC 4019 / B3) TaxID=795797 RepID=D8J9E6_HALJB|nr:ABC transporter permease [Halalkalicoccus jeotgali]ADJ14358.1 binding-protein-dependent transport systems inner membrane component [Halalkalicoccus jeotgali B3]ELY40619.1 binding-protein-dependent transport systems inner membrane component [Halalkalicoccus jeotgali B3]
MVDGEPDRRGYRAVWGATGGPLVRHSPTALLARAGPPVAVLVALLLAWQALVVVYAIPELILPSPLDVARALAETYPRLLADAAVTALTAGLGLLAGTAIGLVLAFSMTVSRSLARTVLPYVVALRIAPLIAIAPLLFLWFGRGIPARALLVTSLTLFPMTIATLDGLRNTPESYLALLESIGASDWKVFLHVRIPAATPSVLAGAKIAATLSVIGAVVAEFVALNAGLGYRVFYTATYLRTAESFAALVVLSALGIAFYLLPVALERGLW